MKLLCVVCCVLMVWVCHGLPQAERAQQQEQGQAQECVLYGNESAAQPVTQFQRRVSVGVIPHELPSGATLYLQSNNKTCRLFFLQESLAPVCSQGRPTRHDDILSVGDTTELWMEVAGRSGGTSSPAWDLRVVARRGNRRAHILIPDTGLQPPVKLWWDSIKGINYYFNCVTGCLFRKSLEMPEGDHSFLLRHDEDFVQMIIDGGVDIRGDFSNQFLINLTAAELGPPGGLKKVNVTFNNQLGNIGVLVDGVPVDDLAQHEPLGKDRQIKVKVAEGSGGLVAGCDPRFQTVAGGDEDVPTVATTTTTTTTTTEPTTTSLPTTHAINSPLTDDTTAHPNQEPSSRWLPAVFTFVLLNFIATVAAISLAIFLYCRSSSDTRQFSKDTTEGSNVFRKWSSTRSSTRSNHRGSQRSQRGSQRNKKTKCDATQDAPASPSGDSVATSETVTTPLTTPEAQPHPKVQRSLSTDEFVSLSLI